MLKTNFIPAETFSERKLDAKIDTIVIHHTFIDDLQNCLNLLTKKEFQVSSHYLLDYDGSIYKLVPDDKMAWHAGSSYWRGREKINNFSIGIEIVNDGFTPFTDTQMSSLIELCTYLKKNHPINDLNIVGHSDISSDRKNDPNIHFDWKKLSEKNIGIYSNSFLKNEPSIIHKMSDNNSEINLLRTKLNRFGYLLDTKNSLYNAELALVINAFKRHHSPESYDIFGWDTLAELRLNDLLAKYYD